MQRRLRIACCALLALTGCDTFGGDKDKAPKLEGTRYEVLVGTGKLTADDAVADYPINLPDAQKNEHWMHREDGVEQGNLAFKFSGQSDSATIGEGNDFDQGLAPTPVIADGKLFAMDAAAIISAHKANAVGEVAWVQDKLAEEDSPRMLGGGLDYFNGVLYASTGYGRVAALDAKSGKVLWETRVGAPVRGAPAADETMVVVITADNQTIALRASDGQLQWEHRGIHESAGFYSGTGPVITDGMVISAYSSGEVFAFREETGTPIWSDTLSSADRTNAAAAFSGVDADPLVQDGVVYVVSAAGDMIASAALNGRPLWQQEIAAHATPWAAGNALFVLTSQNQLLALFKRGGKVRWAKDLSVHDEDGRDITPTLFAPILAGGVVLVADNVGNLHRFDAQTGTPKAALEIPSDVAAPPILVNGRLYFVDKGASVRVVY